jgi:hypothetical protein
MSKKDFKGGFSALLGDTTKKEPSAKKENKVEAITATAAPAKKPKPLKPAAKKKVGRPRKSRKKPSNSSREGTKEGETRATFIVPEETLLQVKSIAYWERRNIKEVVTEALSAYLEAYQEENGPIKPMK